MQITCVSMLSLVTKCQGNFAKYHLVSFRKVPYNVCNGQESNPICLVLGCQNKLCTPVVSSGVRSVLSIVFEVWSEGPFLSAICICKLQTHAGLFKFFLFFQWPRKTRWRPTHSHSERTVTVLLLVNKPTYEKRATAER